MDWDHGDYVSTAPAIFLGGCGRSGTTLLRVILDSHPSICCGPESRLVFLLRRKLESAVLAHRFDLDVCTVTSLLTQASSRAEFIDRFFATYALSVGKRRWAEKSPRNVQAIGYIFKHFPKAHFIHVIRDGRDVACSLRTHPRHAVKEGRLVPVSCQKPMTECIDRWIKDVRAGLAHSADPRVTVVRYEHLIHDTEGTLRRLFASLEEPWCDEVLRFHQVASSSRDITKFPQNPEARRPIYSSAVGRWRRDLSHEESVYIQSVAGDLLKQLGYL
ncbi:MAG TPA: sulfotransferase [Terriglobia bacterium]|nr:sulfotransferase [Terriglobia bacterium]